MGPGAAIADLKQALAARPQSAIGKSVIKSFADGVFIGEIVNFFEAAETRDRECLWEVIFSDGDCEDFTNGMLENLLMPESAAQIVAEYEATTRHLIPDVKP